MQLRNSVKSFPLDTRLETELVSNVVTTLVHTHDLSVRTDGPSQFSVVTTMFPQKPQAFF